LVAGSSWAVAEPGEQKLDAAQVAALPSDRDRSGFPLPVDERVVGSSQQRIATPTGRASTQLALARMAGYPTMIEEQLGRHHLPVQLWAVALAESAFDNERDPSTGREPVRGDLAVPAGHCPSGGPRSFTEPGRAPRSRRATDAAAALLDHCISARRLAVAIAAYNGGPGTSIRWCETKRKTRRRSACWA